MRLFIMFSYENVCRMTHQDTFSNVARRKKKLPQRRSIQISTTLFLKYLFVIIHILSSALSFFSPCTLFAHIHTGMHSYRPRQSGNGYICRLHGSHSARPMERERHFNLPAYYFMTFLMTCFFVVFSRR